MQHVSQDTSSTAEVLERENKNQLGQTEMECIHTERRQPHPVFCNSNPHSLIKKKKKKDVSI